MADTLPDIIHRHSRVRSSSSSLSPFDDVVDSLHSLTSRGVVADLLHERHGFLKAADANEASREICALMTQGLAFLEQGRAGPSLISFLPYYYAFLQFSKAIIACRDPQRILGQKLGHGLSYDPVGPEPADLPSDSVRFRGGVLGLLHEVVTRQPAGPPRPISMGPVYSQLGDATFEHDFAFPDPSRPPRELLVRVIGTPQEDGSLRLRVDQPRPGGRLSRQGNPAVHPVYSDPFRAAFGTDNRIDVPKGTRPQDVFPSHLMSKSGTVSVSLREFYYSVPPDRHPSELENAEEIMIFVSLFHLGSVVRYRPLLMDRIRDSRAITFLRTVERHTIFKMLLLTHELIWSETLLMSVI